MKPISETVHIKRLCVEDIVIAQKLFRLFQDVFESEISVVLQEPYLKRLLEDPKFIVYAAIMEEEPIGGLTAYELAMYRAENSEMFIYDIAIRPEFQRAGLGKTLLSTLRDYCRLAGIKEMFVAANEEDEHALDFYQSAGGKAEKVVHFTYPTDQS